MLPPVDKPPDPTVTVSAPTLSLALSAADVMLPATDSDAAVTAPAVDKDATVAAPADDRPPAPMVAVSAPMLWLAVSDCA
jgi:hypothetical protein